MRLFGPLRRNLDEADLHLGSPTGDAYGQMSGMPPMRFDRLGEEWQSEWSL